MNSPTLRSIFLVCLLFASTVLADSDNDWFFDDFEEKIELVNEGEIAFLAGSPHEDSHSHMNHLVITTESLQTGWVKVRQCHKNLDALDALQINFSDKTTKNHSIVSFSNIERAWVDRSNIELEGISKDAELCLTLDTQNLHFGEDGILRVKNGPYMRQFLDGYYPLHVTLDVSYPCQKLRFIKTRHRPQHGFSVSEQAFKEHGCQVSIDAWFEGKLYTELMFEQLDLHKPR